MIHRMEMLLEIEVMERTVPFKDPSYTFWSFGSCNRTYLLCSVTSSQGFTLTSAESEQVCVYARTVFRRPKFRCMDHPSSLAKNLSFLLLFVRQRSMGSVGSSKDVTVGVPTLKILVGGMRNDRGLLLWAGRCQMNNLSTIPACWFSTTHNHQ